MSHITKEEYLSAFLDGEAGSFEQHRLCDQLECDDLMRHKLASFALIGEAVRNPSQSKQVLASDAFLSDIQLAIADESISDTVATNERTVVASDKIAKRRIFPKQVAGYAVAASVAAIAAISIQNYVSSDQLNGRSSDSIASSTPVTTPPQPIQINTALMASRQQFEAEASTEATQAINYGAPDAETRGMINKYVAHHLQYASSNTLMPSVRAVSYSMDF